MKFSISHVPLTLRHTAIFLELERVQYNFRGFHEQVLVPNLTISLVRQRYLHKTIENENKVKVIIAGFSYNSVDQKKSCHPICAKLTLLLSI